jgi:signal transduction histidine kinase
MHSPSNQPDQQAFVPPDLEHLELRRLLDHAPDAIGLFNSSLQHVYVNQATARANDRPVSDFYMKTMEELGHAPEVCELINRHLRQVFSTGQEVAFDFLFHGPKEPVWFQCWMSPQFSSDNSREFVLVISRDITVLKKAEAALRDSEKKEAVQKLRASLAHELNNPLTTALNTIYLLQRSDSLDQQAKEILAMAEEAIARMTAIAQEMLHLDES